MLLLATSCTKEKVEKSAVEGSWKLISVEMPDDAVEQVPDSLDYYLKISSNGKDGKQYVENCIAGEYDAAVKGNWNFEGKKIKLKFAPIDVENSTDSLVIKNDPSGNTSISFMKDNVKLAELTDDGLIPEKIEKTLSIITVNDKELRVLMDDYVLNFSAKKPVVQTFSFMSIVRGVIGMIFLLFVSWVFSANRKSIDWALIGKGLALQIIIAVLVLKVPMVESAFDYVSKGFVWVIGKTDTGVDFLFGQFGVGKVQAPLLTFAIKVLPTIIFFSALVSLFYYWGILQKIVYVFAWIMKKFMRLSGAESLAAAGNVFLGQTEAPLLVKPYLLGMTKSEIMCLMTGGMATIAGGVLAAYVNFLGGDDPVEQAFFAKHLLTASIISAPAAIIAAKILVPETEKINEDLTISKEKIGTNALEAISNGTTDGLKLAVNVGAMLLVFIALMALGNGLLGYVGGMTGLNEVIAENTEYTALSFEFVLGYACRPVVWLMGVDWVDSVYVGELLGTKTVLNEFVAYPRLGEMKDAGMINEKSIIMSTYMLCGFANFASIGIQIGGIGALIPSRKGLLSTLGIRALIGGTVACLMTAVIVGMTM